MDKIHELMQQEISRKEFLKYIGVALLSLLGVAAMLENLTNTLGQSSKHHNKEQKGYGHSPYGQ